jgi:hypothetical protein
VNELEPQIDELGEHWEKAFSAAEGSPALWQPYLKGISLVVLDEAVKTVQKAAARIRAPSGFFPIYQLAKQVTVTSLSGLIQISQQLEAGQYQQLPNFTTGIVNLLSALHTMSIYAAKNAPEAAAADLSSSVSETLAVLGTAQRELNGKLQQLETADALGDEIRATHEIVKDLEQQTRTALAAVQSQSSDVVDAADDAKNSLIELLAAKKEVQDLVVSARDTDEKLNELVLAVAKLQEHSAKQQTIIDSILPKGASAGLAAAFATRGAKLDPTKRLWAGGFIATVLGLVMFAYYLTTLRPPADIGYWHFILYRVALAGPLIWLGWFSAIQYGNTIRIQEDYAFKQATSVAFQGYRDHLQYLDQIDTDEGGNAMRLLAIETISILARDPLRIYGGVHHDVSPIQSLTNFAQMLRGGTKAAAAGSGAPPASKTA